MLYKHFFIRRISLIAKEKAIHSPGALEPLENVGGVKCCYLIYKCSQNLAFATITRKN